MNSKPDPKYQKVNVKPKRVGNNNTNAINIVINPDENGMYKHNQAPRPSTSQIMNTLAQPTEADPRTVGQILGRVNRLEGAEQLSRDEVEQMMQQQNTQENIDLIQRMNEQDARAQEQAMEFQTISEEVERVRNAMNKMDDLADIGNQQAELDRQALQDVIAAGVQQQLQEFQDRLTQEQVVATGVKGSSDIPEMPSPEMTEANLALQIIDQTFDAGIAAYNEGDFQTAIEQVNKAQQLERQFRSSYGDRDQVSLSTQQQDSDRKKIINQINELIRLQ